MVAGGVAGETMKSISMRIRRTISRRTTTIIPRNTRTKQNQTWQHNPEHRGNAEYPNQRTAQKYGQQGSGGGARPSTSEARGYGGGAGDKGGGRAQTSDVSRGGGGRRRGRPQTSDASRGGGKESAFSGSGRGGSERESSNRGQESRSSASRSSGGFSRSGGGRRFFPWGGGGGGGGRGGVEAAVAGRCGDGRWRWPSVSRKQKMMTRSDDRLLIRD